MGAVRQLVDELRRRGVTVHEWPGWDGRGNADGGIGAPVTQISPRGAVIHHTATPYGSAYEGLVSSTRPDLLGGCLCNFAGNEDGSLTVIASGLAWHAGFGVGPDLGPVLSKIPNIHNEMNRLTVGLEIVYPGDRPMHDVQYRTATIFAAAVADLFADGDIECARAHAETNGDVPGGHQKWDPGYAPNKTIDMAKFRRDADATRHQQPVEDDMPRFDLIRNSDNGLMVLAAPGIWRGLSNTAYVKLVASMGLVKSTTPDLDLPGNEFAFLQSVYLSGALDPSAIAAQVVAALPPGGSNLSESDVENALRKVLGSLDNAPA